MVRRTANVVLAVAVALLAAAAYCGCVGEDEDPAVQMAREMSGGGAPAAPTETTSDVAPSTTEATAEPIAEPGEEGGAEEPADGEEPAEGEAEDAVGVEPPPAGSAADVEGAEGEAAEEAAEPADEGVTGDETEEPVEAAEGETAEEEDEAEAAAEGEEDTGEEAAAVEEEAVEDVTEGEDEEAAEEVDPIARFKEMDPREIIAAKYDDLDDQKTEPWNEDNPEEFIPQTSRSDPLTIVDSAVPEELRPPRTGDTDQNQIDTYQVARVATEVANAIAANIVCHNVIQIGLQKYVTLSVFGERYAPVQEGLSFEFPVGYVSGILVMGSISITSVSTDQVVIGITVYGAGTPTRITKNAVFIPRTYY